MLTQVKFLFCVKANEEQELDFGFPWREPREREREREREIFRELGVCKSLKLQLGFSRICWIEASEREIYIYIRELVVCKSLKLQLGFSQIPLILGPELASSRLIPWVATKVFFPCKRFWVCCLWQQEILLASDGRRTERWWLLSRGTLWNISRTTAFRATATNCRPRKRILLSTYCRFTPPPPPNLFFSLL